MKFKGSPVKSTATDEKMGTIEWTLKNGTRIILKPTTFKADEIQMSATAKGGAAMIPDADEAAIARQFLAPIRAYPASRPPTCASNSRARRPT